MTSLDKPVTRRTKFPLQHRRLVITIHPGVDGKLGTLEMREERRRKGVRISLASVWMYAWMRYVDNRAYRINILTKKLMKGHGMSKREAKKEAKDQVDKESI